MFSYCIFAVSINELIWNKKRLLMKNYLKIGIFAAMFAVCGVMGAQAQIMKAADLEKYAKERYGEF